MKKLCALALALVMLLGLLSGCATNKPSDEKIVIDFSMLNLSL